MTIFYKDRRFDQRLFSKSDQQGFTLIELILSLTIIGLMITFIAPNFGNVVVNSKTQALKAVVKTLEMSLENYQLVEQTYPTGSDLHVSELIQTLVDSQSLTKSILNPYTGQAFTDTDGSGKVTYSYNTQMTTYQLQAWGPDNTDIVYDSTK